MNHTSRIAAVAASASLALIPAAALAQRSPPPSPEQRIDRLERQVDQLQRQVYPRGRPADTAGFATEPAATQSSVLTLDQRLDAVERQMADLLRQSEENGHRLQSVESGIASLRASDDQRIGALEQRMSQAPVAAPVETPPSAALPPSPNAATRGRPATLPPKSPPSASSDVPAAGAAAAADPGEDAYTAGFHQWESGQYDQAITTLRAFTAAYPRHRRISYANNLIGRALLDKGDARGAAEVLLTNYRSNPRGERAQDSLLYLGQALMKLGQPGQSCKAYAELESVYGAKLRPDLKKPLADGKAQAQCS
ncbi:tetratricopeptide repeat protein [Sphingomonas sp.]|uniref:tetratricopeptide repeat protein n=1 Tax=Sphingomonas sp. TaxID=28214 RepID=UPI0025EA9D60|nr:tetratricopeptide repeat protein [Sphingomonas sp.]MBV9529104.1 tetratricopeptide repeat protein [Sphingomonas sp.]